MDITKFIVFFVSCFGTLVSQECQNLTIVAPSDPVLKTRATEISRHEIQSVEVQNIIDQMFEIAKGERLDVQSSVMVGLAAPQVGISKRIILVDVSFDSENRVCGNLTAFINPEIVYKSEDLETDREGCYSVDPRLCGLVPRSKEIEITALDRYGSPIRAKYFGLTARIFQHEIDHLEGFRFPDRLDEKSVMHIVRNCDLPYYRKYFDIWPWHCSHQAWLMMKEGKPYEHLLVMPEFELQTLISSVDKKE